MIYPALRQLLFCLPPETAHSLALSLLDHAPSALVSARQQPATPITAMGLRFANPLGIAAGLDKNGDHLRGLGRLGCGFIELGTVTPKAQPGNEKPRLFRLVRERALINRLGFNNHGIDYLIERLTEATRNTVLGINIGKNLSTPLENANDDYLFGLRRAYPHADYITVNISSPNTPGLRKLQLGDQLQTLLQLLHAQRAQLADEHGRFVPLAVKIAPDMSDAEIRQLCDLLLQYEIDAVIATNTTLTRPGTERSRHSDQAGGLSGAPLTTLARSTISQLASCLQGAIPIIGCGGIMSGKDARGHLQAGATLVQIYSGFIYRGPQLIREIIDAANNGQPS